MDKQKKSFFCHTVLCNRVYLIDYPCCFSLQKGNMSGVKLKKPRKHKMRTFRDREIVLSKEFGCEDRCSFFLLISTPYETKHLNCNCCDSSYFKNLKIELFQVAFLIKIWNRLKLSAPCGTNFFICKPKQNSLTICLFDRDLTPYWSFSFLTQACFWPNIINKVRFTLSKRQIFDRFFFRLLCWWNVCN